MSSPFGWFFSTSTRSTRSAPPHTSAAGWATTLHCDDDASTSSVSSDRSAAAAATPSPPPPSGGDTIGSDSASAAAAAAAALRQQQREQEHQQQQLRLLILTSQNRRLLVNQVRVEGIQHTKPALVRAVVAPLLASSRPPAAAAAGDDDSAAPAPPPPPPQPADDSVALGDLLDQARSVGSRLARLGVFQGVVVELDVADAGGAGAGADGVPAKRAGEDGAEKVDVVFTVKELPRLWGQTGTNVGNNEGSMFSALRLRNVFGGAETLEGSLSYGVETRLPLYEGDGTSAAAATTPSGPTTASSSTAALSALGGNQTTTSFEVLFAKPVNADPDQRLEIRAGKFNRNMALYSAHSEAVTGLGAKFKLFNTSFGTHEIGYDVAWRHIYGVAKDASYTVRRDAGHTLKSAISYSLLYDRRNDALLPTWGHFFKGFMELAGIGGDVLHAKGEVEGQVHVPLTNGFTASGSLRGGLLFPLAQDRPNRINDRFYLGGPLSVRGFQQHGIGPADGADRVGGDMFVAGGVSLFTPLPYLVDAPIKGHLFANAGNLIQLDQDDPITDSARRLFGTVSSSVGLGLAVRFSMLRLEVNYCLPVTVTATDAVKPGLQFGIGLHFA
ncbi:surface antigen-domain-containing protein [Zopfochytrium polystomum]|nr:surface antigen-domain-containing protein [Zopfochytrium polystomum]